MGFVQRVLRKKPIPEAPCPRCGIPSPADADVCAACGWDLSDAYHSVTPGSHLQEPEPDDAEPPSEPRD